MKDALPSYLQNRGLISSNWELIGDYGAFLNRCRIDAWRDVKARHFANEKRVLDLGCSSGSWSGNWQELGFESMVGIDVNQEVSEEAERRLGRFVLGDSATLKREFSGEALVGCNGMIVHVLEDAMIKGIFEDVSACLTPGGHFVCAVLNSDYYVSPSGFRPYVGETSSTRQLSFYRDVAESIADLDLVEIVGTFINPWFCEATMFLAEGDSYKTESIYGSMWKMADALRALKETRLFGEALLVLRKRG